MADILTEQPIRATVQKILGQVWRQRTAFFDRVSPTVLEDRDLICKPDLRSRIAASRRGGHNL